MGSAVAGWGHSLLPAPHLEKADQDAECGGQLHPDTISGHLIDGGVRTLQEVLIWGQGFCHTAHHHRHDSKGACRVGQGGSEGERMLPYPGALPIRGQEIAGSRQVSSDYVRHIEAVLVVRYEP